MLACTRSGDASDQSTDCMQKPSHASQQHQNQNAHRAHSFGECFNTPYHIRSTVDVEIIDLGCRLARNL